MDYETSLVNPTTGFGARGMRSAATMNKALSGKVSAFDALQNARLQQEIDANKASLLDYLGMGAGAAEIGLSAFGKLKKNSSKNKGYAALEADMPFIEPEFLNSAAPRL